MAKFSKRCHNLLELSAQTDLFKAEGHPNSEIK